MTNEEKILILTKRLRRMIIDKQTKTELFVTTVETLLTLLEEELEE